MSDEEIAKLSRAYNEVAIGSTIPDYAEMSLKVVRNLGTSCNDVIDFLRKTVDLPDTTVACVTAKSIALKTDADGNILEFA